MIAVFCDHTHKWSTIMGPSKPKRQKSIIVKNIVVMIIVKTHENSPAIIMARPAHAQFPSNTPSRVPEHQTTQGDQSPSLVYYYYGGESEQQQQFPSSLFQLARQIRRGGPP